MAEHLRGRMHRHQRKVLCQYGQQPEILHYNAVDTNIFQKGKRIDNGGKFIVEQQGIHRHIYFFPVQVCKARHGFKVVARKVFRPLPRVEIAQPKIKGVGAGPISGVKGLHRSRRCEQLNFANLCVHGMNTILSFPQ